LVSKEKKKFGSHLHDAHPERQLLQYCIQHIDTAGFGYYNLNMPLPIGIDDVTFIY